MKTTGKAYKAINELMILGALKLAILVFGVFAITFIFVFLPGGIMFLLATIGAFLIYKKVKNKLC